MPLPQDFDLALAGLEEAELAIAARHLATSTENWKFATKVVAQIADNPLVPARIRSLPARFDQYLDRAIGIEVHLEVEWDLARIHAPQRLIALDLAFYRDGYANTHDLALKLIADAVTATEAEDRVLFGARRDVRIARLEDLAFILASDDYQRGAPSSTAGPILKQMSSLRAPPRAIWGAAMLRSWWTGCVLAWSLLGEAEQEAASLGAPLKQSVANPERLLAETLSPKQVTNTRVAIEAPLAQWVSLIHDGVLGAELEAEVQAHLSVIRTMLDSPAPDTKTVARQIGLIVAKLYLAGAETSHIAREALERLGANPPELVDQVVIGLDRLVRASAQLGSGRDIEDDSALAHKATARATAVKEVSSRVELPGSADSPGTDVEDVNVLLEMKKGAASEIGKQGVRSLKDRLPGMLADLVDWIEPLVHSWFA